MQFGLQKNQQTAGAVSTAATEMVSFAAELGVSVSMQGRRSRVRVKHAVHDFGDQTLRDVENILITRPALRFRWRSFRWFIHILPNFMTVPSPR